MGPFDRFNDRAKRVLALAQDEAVRFNHNYMGVEHLLLGLIREGEGVAARVLESLGVTLSRARVAVETAIGRGASTASPSEITLTPRLKKVIELAIEEARKLGHSHVGTEHLLLAIAREGESVASQVLESLGAAAGPIRATVIETIGKGGAEGGTSSGHVARTGRHTPIAYPREPFESFTDDGQRVLMAAQEAALLERYERIGNEHLLYGIAQLGHGVASDALRALGGEEARIRTALQSERAATTSAERRVSLGADATGTIDRAIRLAARFGGTRAGPEHLLVEILRDPGDGALRVLGQCGVERARLRDELVARLGLSDIG